MKIDLYLSDLNNSHHKHKIRNLCDDNDVEDA